MKLLASFKLSSIGFKVFALFFVSMSIAVAIMGYFSFNKSKEIIRANVSLSALQTIQQANRRLDLLLDEYANRTLLVLGYKEIQRGIMGDFKDTYEHRNNTQQIIHFLSNQVNARNDTLAVHILGEHRSSYRHSSNGVVELPPVSQEVREEPWYKEIRAADGRVVWYGVRPPFIRQVNTDGSRPVFIVGRAIKNLEGRNEIIGVLLMEFDPFALWRFLDEIGFQENGRTLVVDKNNAVVSDFDERFAYRSALNLPDEPGGVLHTTLGGEEMFTVFDRSRVNDWKLVGITPAAELVRGASEIGVYTLYLALAFMLVAVLLALAAAQYMYRPVHVLLRAMRRTREGDFDAQIREQRRDEFGVLFAGFNVMVSRIKSLIDEVYIHKLLQRETQLKMMSSQINAHFLYNTLDSIHWISRIYKADDISTMIFGLSRYLRISLSEGEEYVAVKEVKELLDSYLSIQKVRYQDKFAVRMDIDPSLYYTRVLKYIFQPLVENAIYHGLEKKKEKGELAISWTRQGDVSRFTVTDNGAGIAPDKLAEIKRALEEDMVAGDNFALKNINSQIRLAYGREHGLQIDSEPGVGTVVTLDIPLRS